MRGDEDRISTRYLCDILQDMRDCYKSRNFSYLKGLIEEAQYRANRMENRIGMVGEVEDLETNRIELKKEIKELEEEKKGLRVELDKEPEKSKHRGWRW